MNRVNTKNVRVAINMREQCLTLKGASIVKREGKDLTAEGQVVKQIINK